MPSYLSDLLTRLPRGMLHLHLGHFVGGDGVAEAQQRMTHEVLRRLQLVDGLAVLDVGCGIGGTLAAIADGWSGMRLVGLNIAADQLEYAERNVPEAEFVLGDAVSLPFADGSFDRVVCLEAMFHFSSRARFFAEVARVSRPDGVFAGSDLRIRRGADPALVRMVVEGLGPWPDPFGTDTGGFEDEDVTDAVRPTFRAMYGDAVDDPARLGNAGDRGTAALGALCEAGDLTAHYVHGGRVQTSPSE